MPREKSRVVLADNRRAGFEYFITETFEAGVVLTGSEVKALRLGRSNIAESYAIPDADGIAWINGNIPEFAQAGRFGHAARRVRRLLLKKREIKLMIGAVQREGMALVPLSLYFNERGYVKLALGLGKGKKVHDKRESVRKRENDRELQRHLRRDR